MGIKVQCQRGHYYNAEKFRACPVCNGDAATEPKTGERPQAKNTAADSRTGTGQMPGYVLPQAAQRGVATPRYSHPQEPTEYIFAGQRDLESAPSAKPHEEPHEETHEETREETREQLREETREEAEDAKTMAVFGAPGGNEPVVGWLICVRGEHFGQSFSIKAGNNYIGRSANMDVNLALEESVSRNRHCIITYEPNGQVFYIQQGESAGLTYLNGNMVMMPIEAKARDRIQIGQAVFLLIPLCVGGFKWEDYL